MTSFVHFNHSHRLEDVQLPERFIYEETFPVCEGLFVELKETFNPTFGSRKYYETICSFLNTLGGYLIFGVRDDNRMIQGMKMTPKQVDLFLQFVDSLYNVVREQSNEYDNDKQIEHRGILFKTRIEQISKSYYVCVISCHPEENKKYCLSDGTTFTRTNAGTQKLKSIERMYSQKSIDKLLSTQKEEFSKRLSEREERYYQTLVKQEEKYNKQIKETIIQVSEVLYDTYHSQEDKKDPQTKDHRLFLMVFFFIVCSVLYLANY